MSTEVTIDHMNEVIGVFMGYKMFNSRYPRNHGIGAPEMEPEKCMIIQKAKYHTSWDWLMPVWKKAGEEIFNIRGDLSDDKYLEAHRITKAFMEGCQKVDINQAYNQVYNAVQFIQWYNDNQQKQTNGKR